MHSGRAGEWNMDKKKTIHYSNSIFFFFLIIVAVLVNLHALQLI